MDYNTLKNELTTDPLGVGYAGMSDAEVTASLIKDSLTGKGEADG